jgi:hypothetical protein
MAWLEDMVGGLGSNVLLGVGLTLAAPVVLPTAGVLIRPMAKGLINGYFALTELVQNGVNGAGQHKNGAVKNVSAGRNAQRSTEAKRLSGTSARNDNHQERSPGRKRSRSGAKKTSAARAT